VKQLLIRFATWLHFLIFRREMSPTMREFFSNTLWSFLGVFSSAGIFFTLSIIAGRILGPEGYGRYNLVMAITASLSVFMAAGFDVTGAKYTAQFKEPEKKNAAMSNSLIFVLPFSLVTAVTLFLFRPQLASWLHTDTNLVVLGLLFSLLYTYKNLLDGFATAFKRFKFEALIKLCEAVIALIVFVVLFFILTAHKSYVSYIYALAIASAAASTLFLINLRKNIQPWSKEVFQETRPYLRTFQTFAVIGVVMSSIDRFFVARYLGAQGLGMYGAYLISATVVVGQFILVINNVFFPMVNQVEDKRLMLRNLNRFLAAAAVPIFLVTTGISYGIILLFGKQYPVNWLYITMVSLVAYLQVVASLYVSLLASAPAFFRVSTRINYLKPFLIIALYAASVAVHQVSIPVVLGILVLSYIFDIVNTSITFRLVSGTPSTVTN